MEFIKCGKNYMIKNSNGRIITEEEKIKLENRELVLKDIEGCNCQQETTKKISKNKKRLKEIEKEDTKKEKQDMNKLIDFMFGGEETIKAIKEYEKLETALNNEVQDDIIEETN